MNPPEVRGEGAPASASSIDLATRLAEAAGRARGVARLAGGSLGGAATYGAGRRVEGVRLRPDHIEIHLVASGSVSSLLAVADEVRRQTAPIDPTRRIDVFIDDFDPDIIDLDAGDPVGAGT